MTYLSVPEKSEEVEPKVDCFLLVLADGDKQGTQIKTEEENSGCQTRKSKGREAQLGADGFGVSTP